ncbi:MAG: TetR/AcrR family transcriptional regulator [Gammaproteobacteria bacterium]|nr:TetR/AcrR family transcriptional regulator [Gammaproteobacteria bacterium]
MEENQLIKQLIDSGKISDPETPRGRLLVAAAQLFKEKGYNRTTVRDLAAQVGILSGSIFHHFKNKDEILFAVMNEVVIAMDEALKVSLSKANTINDKVRALIANELDFIHGKTSNATYVMVYEWRALSESYQQQIMQGRAGYFELWQSTMDEARREGVIAMEPDCLRQLLHGAIIWTSHWYKSDGKLTIRQLTNRILSLAIKPSSN